MNDTERKQVEGIRERRRLSDEYHGWSGAGQDIKALLAIIERQDKEIAELEKPKYPMVNKLGDKRVW